MTGTSVMKELNKKKKLSFMPAHIECEKRTSKMSAY